MELRQYFKLLRRWAWLLILGTVLGGAGGYILSQYQTTIYQSFTKVLVMQALDSRTSDVATLSDQQLAQTFIQLIATRPILEATSEKLGYPVRANQIDIQRIQEANLILIIVENSDPDNAAEIANTLVEVFLEENDELQASRFASSEESLLAQIQQVEEQINNLQTQLTDFSATDLDAQTEFVTTTIANLQEEILVLQEEIIQLSFSGVPYQSNDIQGRRILVTPTPTLNERFNLAVKSDRLDELRDLLEQYQGIYVDLSIARGVGGRGTQDTDQLQAALAQYQQIYSNLLNNYESIRLARLRSTPNVVQVEEALPPTTPIRPKTVNNIFLGAVAGFFLAAGLAFLIEYLDDTLRTPAEVEHVLTLPVLGYVGEIRRPPWKRGRDQTPHVINKPRSVISESFRNLRTNLEYADLDHPLETLLVTSPGASDGKTTVAVNLAIVIAQGGKKVVLVDADLRNPKVHESLQLSNRRGLSDVLRGRTSLESVGLHWGGKSGGGHPKAAGSAVNTQPLATSKPLKNTAIIRWHDDLDRDYEYILRQGKSVVIGRDINSDIVLEGNFVSRQHALINWQKGKFEISDLNSANGVAVNGKKIRKSAFLKDGDTISLLDQDLRISLINSSELKMLDESQDGNIPWWSENLVIIPSGNLPPNPAEVLGSEKMARLLEELKERSDIVIIDSTPFILADASTLSARVDGVLPIIRANHTKASEALLMVEQLNRVGSRLVGIVMNRVHQKESSYYYKSLQDYASYSYDYEGKST